MQTYYGQRTPAFSAILQSCSFLGRRAFEEIERMSQETVQIICGVLALLLVGVVVMRRKGKKKEEDDF